MSVDINAVLQTAIPSFVGLGGFLWGIYNYNIGQTLKRKQILFSLIKEFDSSSEMELAKKILDGYSYIRMDGNLFVGWYNKVGLDIILRNHLEHAFRWEKVPGEDEECLRNCLKELLNETWINDARIEKCDRTIKLSSKVESLTITLNSTSTGANIEYRGRSPVVPEGFMMKKENGLLHAYIYKSITDGMEMKIRESFSALLDFFEKLQYLRERHLVKQEELQYFNYYIDKAKNDGAVERFASDYEYFGFKKMTVE